MSFAEVIGDPIAQSKSPIIHRHWLAALGIAGDYARTRVSADELATFLENRRADRDWQGCNVTIPHKERIIPLLDGLESGAEAIGAVNCVVPGETGLTGYNTDIDGVAAVLDSTPIAGRKVAIVGAGGGARAVVAYLAQQGASRIDIIARNPDRAEALRELAPESGMHIMSFKRADAALAGAAVIVNASPLGMAGAAEMPPSLIEAVTRHAAGITAFDMVTTPAATPFLKAAQAGGAAQTVDGLTMLIGQARRAFELFFGCTPPHGDSELRELLRH